jgi:hypothetical protein
MTPASQAEVVWQAEQSYQKVRALRRVNFSIIRAFLKSGSSSQNKGENLARISPVLTSGAGNVSFAIGEQEDQDKVVDDSHKMNSVEHRHASVFLVEGDIASIVLTILDTPIAVAEFQ